MNLNQETSVRFLIKECQKLGILGFHENVDDWYVSFMFEPKSKKCKECGK